MRNASVIMILLVLITFGAQIVWDKIKGPSPVKNMDMALTDKVRKKSKPVLVIDSIPEEKYTYDPDSLLAYKTNAGNDDHIKHMVQGNAYRIFIEKEKIMRSYEPLRMSCHLADGARIIEHVSLKEYPQRGIILWIMNPRVFIGNENGYTCPEITNGKGYYIGKVNISLVDEKSKTILNTVNFNAYQYTIGDTTTIQQCFEIPFAIGNPLHKDVLGGFKYHVTGGDEEKDGMARILYLDDYNGDGNKLEFALYKQEGCMLCNTTLFGYSAKQDKLINYDLKVKFYQSEKGKDNSYSENSKWMEHLFCYKMDTSGIIEYDVDYRGRNGLFTRTTAKYNEEAERFDVEIDQRSYLQIDSVKPAFYSLPVRNK